jgi:hypothetical protein
MTMMATGDFERALEAFLASSEFANVVYDDLAQLPVVPRVVELYRDGTFTVYSRREDARAPDAVVVEIPFGTPDQVRERMRRAFRE